MNAADLMSHTVTTELGCREWQGAITASTGYGKVKIDGRAVDTHRASWIHANGPIPDGLLVCHTCDNRKCINPSHLFLGTYSNNMRDASSKGRTVSGARRLSDDVIRAIYRRVRAGDLQEDIARDFGVANQTVSRVKHLTFPSYRNAIQTPAAEARHEPSPDSWRAAPAA